MSSVDGAVVSMCVGGWRECVRKGSQGVGAVINWVILLQIDALFIGKLSLNLSILYALSYRACIVVHPVGEGGRGGDWEQ